MIMGMFVRVLMIFVMTVVIMIGMRMLVHGHTSQSMGVIGTLWEGDQGFPTEEGDAILTHIAICHCPATACLFYHILGQHIQAHILSQMLRDMTFALRVHGGHLRNFSRDTLVEDTSL